MIYLWIRGVHGCSVHIQALRSLEEADYLRVRAASSLEAGKGSAWALLFARPGDLPVREEL